MPAVVQHLGGIVDWLDVASRMEMRPRSDTPMPSERISFAGPGKSAAELRQAIAAGVLIEVESPTEAPIVGPAPTGIRPQVAMRVNPDFEVKGSGMRMGGGASSSASMPRGAAVLSRSADARLDLLGFHIFAGSQNLRAEILVRGSAPTVDLVLRLAESAAADALPQPRRRLRHPLLRQGLAARPAAIGDNLERTAGGRARPACPTRVSSSSWAATSSASAAYT